MIKKPIFIVALTIFCLFLVSYATADVRLPVVFGDNMVIQRGKNVPVWGWANPGEMVKVSFAGQVKSAKTDVNGKWRVNIDPLKANSTAQELTVEGANQVVVKNVLIGEVWLCSGQSNMQLATYASLNGRDEAKTAKYPMIRLLQIPCKPANTPQDNTYGQWRICSPKTIGSFSGVGYFFGRKLFAELNIPIGLISSNRSGTRIEPWTPPVGFRSVPELVALSKHVDGCEPTTSEGQKNFLDTLVKIRAWLPNAEKDVLRNQHPAPLPQLPSLGVSLKVPTKLYNGMIHPLTPFAMRGAIWYQGEANGNEGLSYYYKTKALISGWRNKFENPDLSFYFVQLANYQKDSQTPEGGTGFAKTREAQRKSLEIPNTGMAVIIDIGESGNIHPKNKQDVGLRLARWALANNYGQNIVPSGPLYKEYKVENNKIRIFFDYVGGGLMAAVKEGLQPPVETKGGKLKRFAIAGKDNDWHWAEAVIDANTILVSCSDVPKPIAVRYAYDACPTGCNFYNKEGLPASPFRTDE